MCDLSVLLVSGFIHVYQYPAANQGAFNNNLEIDAEALNIHIYSYWAHFFITKQGDFFQLTSMFPQNLSYISSLRKTSQTQIFGIRRPISHEAIRAYTRGPKQSHA